MKPAKYFLLILLSVISISSASGQIKKKKQQPNYAYFYNNALTEMHPEFFVFNFTKDSCRLYASIKQKELKYAFVDAREIAYISIKTYSYQSLSEPIATDSTALITSDIKGRDSLRTVVFTNEFKSPSAATYFLKILFTDIKSDLTYEAFLQVSNKGNQNQNAFMITASGSTNPVFENVVNSNDSVFIHRQKDSQAKCTISYFATDYAPASPPFQPGAKKRLVNNPDKKFDFVFNSNPYLILKGYGYYFFQYDTTHNGGYTICRFGKDYPQVNEIDQKIEALRYLLNQQEYFEFKNTPSPGKRFKQFWDDLAASSETPPHLLMATYYSRVVWANKYFTSFCEGWKTDRGMMYIIFGKPDAIAFDEISETWTYAKEFDNLKLTFIKQDNPHSGNDYILQRNEKLEIPWQSALNSWRTGFIFGL